jgi:hypothetical protein
MFGWIDRWRSNKVRVCAEAECLIHQHGGQTRHVLADHIRESEAKGQETKEVWRVLREVKRAKLKNSKNGEHDD